MRADYNPFNRENTEETESGLINYRHNMGTVYITHRNKYDKEYEQTFLIDLSELEMCFRKNVYWIMILHHKTNGTCTPYRIQLEKLTQIEDKTIGTRQVKELSTNRMQIRQEEGWTNI